MTRDVMGNNDFHSSCSHYCTSNISTLPQNHHAISSPTLTQANSRIVRIFARIAEEVRKALFTSIAGSVVLAIDAHTASLLIVHAKIAVTVAEALFTKAVTSLRVCARADAASERRVVGAQIGFLATVALLTDERRIVERPHVASVVEKRLATIAARSIRARRRCAIALVDWIGKGRFGARRSEAVAAASSRYPQISNCKKFCTLDSRKLRRVISQLISK